MAKPWSIQLAGETVAWASEAGFFEDEELTKPLACGVCHKPLGLRSVHVSPRGLNHTACLEGS